MEYRFKGQGQSYLLKLDKNTDAGYTVTHDETVIDVKPESLGDNRLVLGIGGRRRTLYVAESRDKLYVYFGGRQYVLRAMYDVRSDETICVKADLPRRWET